MVYSFNDAQAKSPHTVQYSEFMGNRGIYKDGWYATALHKVPWEPQPVVHLIRTSGNSTTLRTTSVARSTSPQRIPRNSRRCRQAFLTEAVKYNVLPLDDRVYERFNPAIAGRPDLMGGPHIVDGLRRHGRDEGERLHQHEEHAPTPSRPIVEAPQSAASGVILAQGGLHSGFAT